MIANPYQFLPDLLPDEYDALRVSIAGQGVQVPIVVDQDGNIIDGFNRQNICNELGMFCQREIRQFRSETEKFELSLHINCRRRQFSREQKRELIAAYLRRDPQIADNYLAETIGGVSKNTVADIREELSATCQIDKFETLRGKDGKVRPRKYKKIIANTPNEAKTAFQVISDLPDSCDGKTIDITSAKRRARQQSQKDKREHIEATVPPVQDEDIRLFHCPFQELRDKACIQPGSVDLVLTDFPYVQEFLPQIAELAEFAATVLRDGGLFVTYSGTYHLQRIMADFEKHLTYRWMCATIWDGDGSVCHQRNVVSKWKPVLVYSKGDWQKRPNWVDVSKVNSKEKDWHNWQQPLEEVELWVRQFSQPGDLVVEPCGGGFTTAVACRKNNRRFIGCDVESNCVQIGQQRLADAIEKILKKS